MNEEQLRQWCLNLAKLICEGENHPEENEPALAAALYEAATDWLKDNPVPDEDPDEDEDMENDLHD